MNFFTPPNEKARLEALRSYEILDTAAEQSFDDITRLASFICGAPIAIMTLVDEDRQWFKSKVGLAATETPREQAFCAYTILQPNVMIVEDATLDARFAQNPLVTSDPHIRFYAGAPLVNSEGLGLGSLCVIDRQPRQISPAQTESLSALGRLIVSQMEQRRAAKQLAAVVRELDETRRILPICAWCKGIRNDAGYFQAVETYIAAHSDIDFTHCLCPECGHKNFPDSFPKPPAPRAE